MTLHRRTGKSREEHEAAGTLLDLSLESVVSVQEAEIEGLQEMEELIVDQFPEPFDSNVDRDTQTDKKMLRECATQVRHLQRLTHFHKGLHLNYFTEFMLKTDVAILFIFCDKLYARLQVLTN